MCSGQYHTSRATIANRGERERERTNKQTKKQTNKQTKHEETNDREREGESVRVLACRQIVTSTCRVISYVPPCLCSSQQTMVL